MPQVSITKQPLLPVITITKNDSSLYTFNHFLGTYDFRLQSLQFEPVYDSSGGKFDLRIISTDATNSAANTFLNNISAGSEVAIWVGKSNATKTKMFLGMIEEINILEPNKNYMQIQLKGPDWGSAILKNRIVRNEWRQKYKSDGVTLDSKDAAVLISQITQDLLNQTRSYPSADYTVADQGVIVSAANINPVDVPLAQFTAQYEKLDDKLGDLDKVGASVHFVDPSKNFIMKQATSTNPTTILLTDDYSDTTAVAWIPQTSVGLILPNSETLFTLETHKRRIYGIGGNQTDQFDQKQETNTTSTASHTNYLSQRFTPTQNNIYDCGVILSKTGTPTVDPVLEITEDNGNKPEGTTLKSAAIDKNAVIGTAAWHLFSFDEALSTSKNYWITLRLNGDVTNHFNWHRDNTSSFVNAYSTTGTVGSWTVQSSSYGYTFRQYYSNPLVESSSYDLSATAKHFYEQVIKEADITKKQILDSLILAESLTAFKLKNIFKGKIYAPDTLITTGDKIRIRKQASGYVFDHDDFVVGAITYIFQSSEDQSTGIFTYSITATRFIDFA